MNLQGIDLDGLAPHSEVAYPPTVPGRVVQIDADFLAYQVSYEYKDDVPKTVEDMQHNSWEAVEHIRKLAGAQEAALHLTPEDSTKGNRFKLAILKQYQGNRVDREKPVHLHTVRTWMHHELGAIMYRRCEADDGMAMAQHDAHCAGEGEQSIIATKDKDLRMCHGWHMDWETGNFIHADGFGSIELVQKGKTKKLIGLGSKFFWAQLLMGDPADNISGLPCVHPKVLNRIDQTADVIKAMAVLKDPEATPKQIAKAEKAMAERKPKKCGPAMAHKILEHVKDDKRAFELMKRLFELSAEVEPFRHWETGKEVHWKEVLLSEMKLLWMRRAHNENDVIDWLKEVTA